MASRWVPSVITGSPRSVALTYVLAGAVWIVLTDWGARLVVADPATMSAIQTAKGWVFVAASGLLLYWLVAVGQRDLATTNDRLERAVNQTRVFHRILRHNIRNQCTVILGHADRLTDRCETGAEHDVAIIEEQAERLVGMSEKSSLVRDVAVADESSSRTQPLAAVVEDALEAVGPIAGDREISVHCPDGVAVSADPHLRDALVEVLENALEYNDFEAAPVHLTARPVDGLVRITVADAGPGLPAVERAVVERGTETQLSHSEGLGLWIARTIVEVSGGRLTASENDLGGTTVELTVPRAA